MWRTHSCVQRRHSCRRPLPRAQRRRVRLDAARRSACATRVVFRPCSRFPWQDTPHFRSVPENVDAPAKAERSCTAVLRSEYYWTVTASELKRKLAKLGCTFEQGTRHLIVRYQGNRTLMPRHPSQEIQTGTCHAILKKLRIKE